MLQQQYLMYAYFLGISFGISVCLTYVVRRLAIRYSFLDHPGERKMQKEPMPLMGGVAIVVTFYSVILIHMAVIAFMNQFGFDYIEARFLYVLGEDHNIKVTGILAGGFLIFLLGIVDDLKALTPWVKLTGQIAAALVLVLSGIRIELFILKELWLSGLVTIFWIVMLTNSLNFLDNMDGLSGGVSVIAAFSFFLCLHTSAGQENQLVRLLLMVFAGAVAGFLYHNLSPARIYMGDAGAMFNGYFLASMAVIGTFHVESTPSRIAVAAPLLALAVPLFDTASVVWIRWRRGESIMMGDKRHFSHRLVALGMTPRQAVEFIFLVAGVIGLGAALLPILDVRGTFIIIAQTAGIFLLIVLLMTASRKRGDKSS
ncbi:MAG: undecaprenyl/decaprenyl-phosphate alpha-N-acetylglucosaminyl 1-phosphate transferase [Candidatus Hydrogenedentes bacterium]|nr:undecaprenyl/decaprenyl-phosphate alpha-N-acetylglucosaminyl 1-phosphate transferase [Candidatus Hydrogenedentota bacterium]